MNNVQQRVKVSNSCTDREEITNKINLQVVLIISYIKLFPIIVNVVSSCHASSVMHVHLFVVSYARSPPRTNLAEGPLTWT